MQRFSISRRLALAAATLAVFSAVAIGSDPVIIHFAAPETVTAGQNLSAGVTVNQAPMSVTFTSNPPGLVNFTTTVNSTSSTVSIPTSSGASGSTYVVTARPSSGGTGQSASVAMSTNL